MNPAPAATPTRLLLSHALLTSVARTAETWRTDPIARIARDNRWLGGIPVGLWLLMLDAPAPPDARARVAARLGGAL
jgi:hypothetical protein